VLNSSRFRRTLDVMVIIGALATVPLTVLLEQHRISGLITALDWLIWAIFAFEFLGRAMLDRPLRMKANILPLAVVVVSFPLLPAALGLVRLVRLSRAFRALRLATTIVRGMTGLRAILARRGVAYVAGLSGLLIVAGGAALTLVEPQTVRGGFADGVWWAVVTASTVGYGDIAPVTLVGRVIAVLMMLAGVGLISTLAASVTAYFVGQESTSELTELRESIVRLEARIESLLISVDRERIVPDKR
jgi:voltage-gated potassium channel